MKKLLLTITAIVASLQLHAQQSPIEPYTMFVIYETYNFQTGSVLQDNFTEYVLIDLDGDGSKEIWVRTADGKHQAVFADTETDTYLIAWTDEKFEEVLLYKGAACANHYRPDYTLRQFAILDHSIPETWLEVEETPEGCTYKLNNEIISAKKGEKMLKKLGYKEGKGYLTNLQWLPIPEDLQPKG